jgi:hypothetical protein
MIAILAAVVILVGAVAVADLLLSFAIIRRLAASQARGAVSAGEPARGHVIGAFRVRLLADGEFTPDCLRHQPTTVVFLSPHCEPCRQAITELAELPVPLSRPLFVLIAGSAHDDDVLAIAAQMPAGAQVGAIAHDDAIMKAFAVDGYPTVVNVADGIVRSAGFRVSELLEPVRG